MARARLGTRSRWWRRSGPRASPDATALALVTLVVLLCRVAAIDPPSLWLDDQWVGIVVRELSLGRYFELLPPLPVGFLLIEKACAALASDREWPLLLAPALFSAAVVPSSWFLARRLGTSRTGAYAAAAIVAVSPYLVAYGASAKAYTLDAAACVALLLAGEPLLRRWRGREAAGYLLIALPAALCSFASVLVSWPLWHGALVLARRRGGELGTSWPWAGTACLNGALALLYGALWRFQRTDALTRFWADNFVPLESAGAAGRFLVEGTAWLGLYSFPEQLGGLAWGVPIGLVALLATRRNRALGGSLLVVLGAFVLAALLHKYPYPSGENGRTATFLYPVVAVVAVRGWDGLARTALARIGGPATARTKPWCETVAGTVLAASILVGFLRPASYDRYAAGSPRDAELVRKAARYAGPDVGMILYPPARLAAAYYGPWPFEAEPASNGHGFDVHIRRDHTFEPGTRGPARFAFRKHPRLASSRMRAFLEAAPDRLVVLATHLVVEGKPALRWIHDQLRGAGFRPVHRETAPAAALVLYRRSSTSRRPMPPHQGRRRALCLAASRGAIMRR